MSIGTKELSIVIPVYIAFVFAGMPQAPLGLIGEYIGKIHQNARARPQYFIAGTTLEKSGDNAIFYPVTEQWCRNENSDC